MIDYTTVTREIRSLVSRRRELLTFLGTVFAATIRTSQLHVANTISSIGTRGLVEGLQVTAGRVKKYDAGAGSFTMNWSVAGPIESFHTGGDLDQTSVVQSVGTSAHIGNFIVDGDLNGQVRSVADIDLPRGRSGDKLKIHRLPGQQRLVRRGDAADASWPMPNE